MIDKATRTTRDGKQHVPGKVEAFSEQGDGKAQWAPKGFGNHSLGQAPDGRAPSGLSFRHSQISFAKCEALSEELVQARLSVHSHPDPEPSFPLWSFCFCSSMEVIPHAWTHPCLRAGSLFGENSTWSDLQFGRSSGYTEET